MNMNISHRARSLLVILAEEACELGQASTKLHRFGERLDPHFPERGTNIERLAQEADDVRALLRLLECELGNSVLKSSEIRISNKIGRVERRLAETMMLEKEKNQ